MAEEKPLELRVVSPSKEVINPEQGLSDERSSRQGVRCDLQENLVDSEPDVLQKSDKLYGEPELLKIVQEETYDKIHGRITAKNLMTISQNPLSLAIKVSPFMIFSFRKYVYSYKLPDLHFTVQLFLENVSIRE